MMGVFIIIKCGGSVVKECMREWNLQPEFLVWFDRREDHKSFVIGKLF